MKHLVVDGRVFEGGPSGVRAVAKGVVSGLRQLESEGLIRLTVAGSRPGLDVALPGRLFMHLRIPRAASLLKADALLIPRQARPIVSAVPCLPIFHDLGFITHREYYSHSWKVHAANRLALMSRRALAVSEFAAEEVRSMRPSPDVDVLPIGAMHAIEWAPAESSPYLLCIAVHEPHKNLVALVGAWKRAQTDGYRLVICGREGAATVALRSEIARLGLEGEVSLLSGLPDGEYRALLAGCSAYIQPSFHEGLCIPAMDMAAAGVPTAVSDEANLGRVFGGADPAQTLDARSVRSIAEAIERILHDQAHRSLVSAWNSRNVSLTDWRKVGQVVVEAIE